ncbi:GntR family transcriptional regulator [Tropicimonas sp. IMCC34043]|uniref:GntR family transcriptional regulator n=1 Tax=Tropicimonas sp. IMCC34043 TaxID=2248760 RepID=UPI000E241918|nr:GntR family transcriptional regulator [Tropicimonas sp. IMCC34043]
MIDPQQPDPFARLAARWEAQRPQSKVDAIVGILRDAIVSGELPPTMPLRQDPLAQRFGISKIPLREALARLEAEGFVVTHPGRGAFVTDLRAESIREIFQLRIMLETELLRAAVPMMTGAALTEAARLIELFETAPTRDLGQVNWQIHSTLYAPSGRELSLQMLQGLHKHAERYVQIHMGEVDTGRGSNDEHRAILAACRRGETAEAVEILRAHLDGIGQAICSHFEMYLASRAGAKA